MQGFYVLHNVSNAKNRKSSEFWGSPLFLLAFIFHADRLIRAGSQGRRET